MALQAVNRGESLSDRAYRMLRNAILSGELAPGEPLTEESLAERLQISRTPIRTALHRLVSEGLAETACGKGISVREVGDRDVRQVDEVRAVLEPLSASLCAARGLSAGEIEELRGYCEAQQQAAARGGVRDYFHYGDLFHIRLAECSGNDFLAAMISRATLTAARYLLTQSGSSAASPESIWKCFLLLPHAGQKKRARRCAAILGILWYRQRSRSPPIGGRETRRNSKIRQCGAAPAACLFQNGRPGHSFPGPINRTTERT